MTAHTTEPQPEPARELLRADLLIIGSGIAGLFVALQAHQRGAKVLVVTKSAIDEASTRYAQGGISAAIGPGDSPELHLRDTIEAGAGLVDAAAARVLVEEAAGRIADLGSYGVRFDEAEGEAALGKEGAHSARRVLRARGDQTGLEIELSLSSLVQREGITVLEHALAERLLVADGRAIGADVLCADDGARLRCEAETVVLATGGAGQVYRVTTNPQVATGDGVALAFRAGAEVQDMEFTQFHPTALRLEGQPSFLISEAVRGEGALLFDTAGRRFMADIDPAAELAPRNIVALAELAQMRATGSDHVLLDITHRDAAWLAARFPNIYRTCLAAGLDMARDRIPVSPAAHYTMGGVRTDTWGRTTLPGLYAVGEVTCTGVHGANRLASNSLLESVVFAHRLVEALHGGPLPEGEDVPPALTTVAHTLDTGAAGTPADRAPSRTELRDLMWSEAGLERDGARLGEAAAQLAAWEAALPHPHTREEHEVASLLTCGRLITEAALLREESRGAHYRRDFPEQRPEWRRRLVFRALA